MVMAQTEYWTVEMVQALPDDGNRYEVVHGELLVTPSPNFDHQDAAARLIVALRAYADREPAVYVAMAPADVYFGTHSLVQPDLFAIPRTEARRRDWKSVEHLLLAIEVLSPSSARADRFTKRRLYQSQGVPLYWVVDAGRGVVEVWTPADDRPTLCRDVLRWHPAGAETAFELQLSELFAPF